MVQFRKKLSLLRRAYDRVFIRSTVYMGCVLLTLSCLIGWVSYTRQVENFDKQLLASAKSHARVLINLSENAFLDYERYEIRHIGESMREEDDISNLDILDFNLTSYMEADQRPVLDIPQLRKALQARKPIRYDTVDSLVWIKPIIIEERMFGLAAIVMNKDGQGAVNSEVIAQTVTTTLVVLFICLPIAGLLLHRSTRGISTVTDAANEAAQGFLDPNLKIDSQGEVRELQLAFRTMAGNLRSTIQRIEQMANVDHVTLLPNRLKFGNYCSKFIEQKPGAKGTLLFLGLDRFKTINDIHGHEVGDKMLKNVANGLQAFLGRVVDKGLETSPFLSRWSGDEFIILLPGITDPELVNVVAEELLADLRRPMRIDGHVLKVRGSIGIATYPEHGKTVDSVVRAADMAMFTAKQNGRDQLAFYDEKIMKVAEERENMEKLLREALPQGEFQVVYQPKVDLKTQKIVGAEALLRWHNPSLGTVPPFKFIPIAEECGLMTSIGEFVLRRSLADMGGLRAEGISPKIAINVSPVQFQGDFFTDRTLGLLGESGYPLDLIELEITESSLGGSPEQIRQQMMPLKEEGVSFAIDDFGTGFSNLGMLTSLPFDTLKIDRSFVMNIGEDESRRNMVQVILLLARQLNMKTVAEGIETEIERNYLSGWGAQLAQGYLWSPPVPLDKFRVMLLKERDEKGAVDGAVEDQLVRSSA